MTTSTIGAGQHTAGRPRPTTLICGCGHSFTRDTAAAAIRAMNRHDCNAPVVNRWPYAGRTADLVEDLTFMLAHGETRAARRLGIPTEALVQRLRRCGHSRLANIVNLQETWTC